jgi:8-oxo-dGTP pyrophosphatase MutT (NUDIX family)
MDPTTPIEEIFEELTKGLPKFEDGRVDYTHARKAPVVTVVVYHDGKILLLRRSDKVLTHARMWSNVAGYIDEPRSAEDFALQELSEEIGLDPSVIKRLTLVGRHERSDPKHQREWLVYTVLAELHHRPDIKLDWEHTDFAWVTLEELSAYDGLVEDFEAVVKRALDKL